jgi:hypothetical protein
MLKILLNTVQVSSVEKSEDSTLLWSKDNAVFLICDTRAHHIFLARQDEWMILYSHAGGI